MQLLLDVLGGERHSFGEKILFLCRTSLLLLDEGSRELEQYPRQLTIDKNRKGIKNKRSDLFTKLKVILN